MRTFRALSGLFIKAGLISAILVALLSTNSLQADVNANGSFSSTIDIKLPPRLKNMAPKLSLEYNSHAGNGMLGMGWQLTGLPVIKRAAYTGAINYSAADTFVESNAGILAPQGGGIYFSKNESFSKFTAVGVCGGGPCSWIVQDRSGMTLYYGDSNSSRIEAVRSVNDGSVRVWALTRVEDRNGNSYEIIYDEDTVNGDFYPLSITYTKGAGISEYYTIEFSIESRSDAAISYADNAKEFMDQRITAIRIKAAGSLLRKYQFDYQNGTATGHSRLTAVQEYGSGSETLPATTFSWQDGGTGFSTPSHWYDDFSYGYGFTDNDIPRMISDVNGDGKMDITVFNGGGVQLLLSTGTGFSYMGQTPIFGSLQGWTNNDDYPRTMADVNADGKADIVGFKNGVYVSLSAGNCFTAPSLWYNDFGYGASHPYSRLPQMLADVNGDGKADVVVFNGGGVQLLLSTGASFSYVGQSPADYSTPHGYDNTGKNPRMLADVNGDGKADIVGFHNSGVFVSFSTGTGFTSPELQISEFGTDQGWTNTNDYPRTLADMNGDGKADIVGFKNGVYASLSTGSGFTPPSLWYNDFGYGAAHPFNDLPQMLADVNGDGKADLLVFNGGGVQLLLSTGTGFTYMGQTPDFGYLQGWTDMGHYPRTMADINGDGKADIVGFGTGMGTGVKVSLYGSMNSNNDLLTSISNGLGGTTNITYTPATQVSGAVRADITATGNANPSPQPLVTAVTTTDGRGLSFNTTYAYSNGRYIPGPADVQANLGFASFTETNNSTGIVEITLFNQDASIKHLQGTPYQQQVFAGGSIMSQTTYTYDSVSPNTGTTFVRLLSETNSTYSPHALSFSRTKSIAYDGYGNQTQVVESATGIPDVTTATTYNVDTYNWSLGLPTAISVTSGASTLKQTTISYSGANPTQVCTWIGSGSWGCTNLAYNANGNVVSSTDPLGRTTTLAYDTQSNAQVARVTDAMGHVSTKTYTADGQIASQTDVNGNVTTNSYDTFGRLAETNLPNGGRVTYGTANLGEANSQYRQTIVLTDGSRTITKNEYFDGAGFVYKETTTGDNGSVQVLSSKDSAGRNYSTSQPHHAGGNANWTIKTFDAAGRVVAVSLPNGSTVTNSYGADSIATTANGRTTTKTFNAAGKVASIADAMGNTTTFNYDALGRVTGTTLADGSTTSISYDGLGHKISITEPNTGTTNFAYNAAGSLVSQTNARGQTINFAYDALGRVTLKDLPAGAGTDVSYRYDEAGFANGNGRLTSKTDEGGITQYSYDAMGQILSKQMIVDNKSYSYTTIYDYAKRPTEITYPDGSLIKYTYTDGGNLATLVFNDTTYATWSNYDTTGKPAKLELANGTSTDYTYDGTVGKINSLVTTAPAGQIQNLTYAFDNGTNVTAITDNRSTRIDAATGVNTDETVSYTYDNLDRLTGANGVWGAFSYSYNAVGNATSLEGRALTYSGQRATSGTNFIAAYDATGNTVSQTVDGVSWSYDYDAENRITKIYRGGSVATTMAYDDNGQRVKKIYNRPDDSQVITIYIGSGYEIRKRDGNEFHTINLHGNGQLIASITQQGMIQTSMNEFQKQIALAGLYSAKSFMGLMMKGGTFIAAVMVHPKTMTRIAYAFSFAMIAGILGLFLISLARERGWLGATTLERRPVFGMKMRVAAMCTALVLSQTNCGNAGGGGGFSFWPFGGSGLYHVPLSQALTGDTLNGLPLGTYFYHKNQINSSAVITDATGAEATRVIYRPFGTVDQDHSPGVDTVTHKFTGQEFDEESGLYYYNARYYNAAIGRFMTADTVVPGNGEDPQGFNRYAYVLNNPVKYTDPSGHIAWLAAIMGGIQWAVAGATGATVAAATGIAGGMAWAAKGIAGGAAWAGSGVAGGTAWASRGAAGGTAWAGNSVARAFSPNGVKGVMRSADHSARGILENLDHSTRRIGETWEELKGTRHANYDMDLSGVIKHARAAITACFEGDFITLFYDGLAMYSEIGYQAYLNHTGLRAYEISLGGLVGVGAVLAEATHQDPVKVILALLFLGPSIINAGHLSGTLGIPSLAELKQTVRNEFATNSQWNF